ncbi:MAG TPA: Nif3-like dinuclear metal center hexameric protein [Candidatus Acidoferrales bacterium]|nr:Nif3-like dinuclear metal center hexameric protein [Candidatus Acidoferrales bacterium]
MHLDSLIESLEAIAPPELADPIDDGRIGLVSRGRKEVNSIAVALDPTKKVIERAVQGGADILITHHALIWDPITTIPFRIQKQLSLILNNDMSFYVMHTNYDAAPEGVNDVLAKLFGLQEVRPFGIGRIGTIEPISTAGFARHVAQKLRTPVQFVGRRVIQKVALIGGEGFDATEDAISAGADALLSAEMKHAAIRCAEGRLSLVDATHYATEAPAMRVLARRLGGKFIDDRPQFYGLPFRHCYQNAEV